MILLDPENNPSVRQGKTVTSHFIDVGTETLSELPGLTSLCAGVCLLKMKFYIYLFSFSSSHETMLPLKKKNCCRIFKALFAPILSLFKRL